jgi:predicted lipoprotein
MLKLVGSRLTGKIVGEDRNRANAVRIAQDQDGVAAEGRTKSEIGPATLV